MIKNIRIEKIETENTKLRAYASLILYDKLVINNLRIVEGKDGLFVSMPMYKKDDKFYDVVHIFDKNLLDEIKNAVIKKYNEVC